MTARAKDSTVAPRCPSPLFLFGIDSRGKPQGARFRKEHASLAKMIKPYLEFQKVTADVAQAQALAAGESDPEMQKYAQEELAGLKAQQQALESKLEELLLGARVRESRVADVVVEVEVRIIDPQRTPGLERRCGQLLAVAGH